MLRRGLSAMLLVVFAVQLLGAMAVAGVCLEPCPDDTGTSGCAPVCSICTGCSHARQAIVHAGGHGVTFVSAAYVWPQEGLTPSAPRAADIFHVPLPC